MLLNRILFRFSTTSPLGRLGIQPQSFPPLPKIQFPMRQRADHQQQIPKQQIYDFLNFKTKQFARCRYFVQQYKGNIYHIFDSSRYPFGKMMNKIATVVRGKNTPLFKNNIVNKGSIAIVVNAQDPLFTGRKLRSKELIYHTGFVGHLKREPYRDLMARRPELLYYNALNKCMPKNKLRKPCFENLYVYRGKTHSFPFLNQFAPDKNTYEGLPEVNFLEIMQQTDEIKILSESEPGLAKQMFGVEMEYAEKVEDTRKYEMIPDISRAELTRLRKRQKKLEERHKKFSAIKKKKPAADDTFQYFDSEAQIKRSEYADRLLNKQEIDEDEEEIIKQVYGPPKQYEPSKKQEQGKEKEQTDPKKK